MNKIAIGISCWNRPQYFSQLISTLESNFDSRNQYQVDTHLFIDGNICAFTGEARTDNALINQCIEIWQKAVLPNKQLHRRVNNIGTAIHQFEMMQMLTSVYNKIIFLEDDIIVSPNFVLIMRKLLDYYEKDKDIFSISPGFKLLCKEEEVDRHMNSLKLSEGHFWAEAIWSDKWKEIVPRLKEYIEIVSQKPYRSRDNQKIRNLFQRHGRSMPATSQDNAKDWAISLSKMKRARLVVNRATGIGDIGIHSTKSKLAKSGDGHNKIHVFENEESIEDFKTI